MAQQPIEMILLHLWASYIAIPMWVVDADGNLAYYNEPAEALVGVRFDEAGEINATDLAEMFVTTDLEGNPLSSRDNPLVIALAKRVPVHTELRIKALDGSSRHLGVTALPIEGQGGRHLGALAAFWEVG